MMNKYLVYATGRFFEKYSIDCSKVNLSIKHIFNVKIPVIKTICLIISLTFFQLVGNSQNVKHYFHDTNASIVFSEGLMSLSVYSIASYNGTIVVTMVIKSLKEEVRMEFLPPSTEKQPYLIIGDKKLFLESWRFPGQSSVPVSENTYAYGKNGNLLKPNYLVQYDLIFKGVLPTHKTKVYLDNPGRVSCNGLTYSFNFALEINGPRKHYTNYSSEYSIKQHLDANNDGICGIYEVMGQDIESKFACIKHNGEYTLIFVSDNQGRSWWKMGDIKAYLRQSASGIFKADWFMSDKSVNKDCYVTFDGVSMTVNHVSGSDPGETKYLKMYPTTPPSLNRNQQQERKQTPKTKQIPVLKKQNVK